MCSKYRTESDLVGFSSVTLNALYADDANAEAAINNPG